MSRRRIGLVALLVLVCASATLVQPYGYNQFSHFALVHALADGSPSIDRYRNYSGDESFYHGHFYSNKAPGLAFVSLPAFVTLRAVGLRADVHSLTLWSVLLPAAILLLLVRSLAERLAPGLGTATAATLGAATLVLPFTGLFFAHVLSALLGFAAFALLWREREGPERLALLAGAGLLAGYAVVVEYPLAIVGGILLLYALARRLDLRRAATYAAGFAVGVTPLLLFDWWAFRNPFHVSYGDVTIEHGTAAQRAASVGLHAPHAFGLAVPSPRVALELLLSARGLLTLTPVVAVGAAATVALYRSGRRAEALVVGAVAAAFVVYNAAFWGQFGGWGPGPRYLVPMLPFLAVPLALAWRRLPLLTGALAAVSFAIMLAAKATVPLLPARLDIARYGDVADPDLWAHRLFEGRFTRSLASEAGLGRGWIGILPFALLIGTALVLAALATGRLAVSRRDTECAVAALAGWLVVLRAAPVLLRHDRFDGGSLGAVAAAVLAALVVFTVVRVVRSGWPAALPALPLVALAVPAVPRHPPATLLVLAVALLATAVAERRLLLRIPRTSDVPARLRP